MKAGITLNDKHSYHDFRLRMLKRFIEEAPKDDLKERVPFSSVTYDFSEIYGKSYGERKLSYTFELLCPDLKKAQERLTVVRKWLKFSGKVELYDDMFPDYHFEVSEPELKFTSEHGVHTISMVFMASPFMTANLSEAVNPSRVHFPDIDGNGYVDGRDATTILRAASKLSAGRDPELTPEQLYAADANGDGIVDQRDATLVLRFTTLVNKGDYTGDLAGWIRFLEDKYGKEML